MSFMAHTTNFGVRVDAEVKRQCGHLYRELGFDLSTAVNVFLRQSLRAGGFPFEVPFEPNRETAAAMEAAERLARAPGAKRYAGVEEAIRELKR